jgi:hypothetical protein
VIQDIYNKVLRTVCMTFRVHHILKFSFSHVIYIILVVCVRVCVKGGGGGGAKRMPSVFLQANIPLLHCLVVINMVGQ